MKRSAVRPKSYCELAEKAASRMLVVRDMRIYGIPLRSISQIPTDR